MSAESREGTMSEDEREQMAQFWQENQGLFETLGERLGECAVTGDLKRFGLYVSYLERIIGLAIQVARQVQRGEAQAAHA